eukprot:gene28507-31664_t
MFEEGLKKQEAEAIASVPLPNILNIIKMSESRAGGKAEAAGAGGAAPSSLPGPQDISDEQQKFCLTPDLGLQDISDEQQKFLFNLPDLGLQDISDEQQKFLFNLPDLGLQDISDEQQKFLFNLPDLGLQDISDEQQKFLFNLPDLGMQDISDEQQVFLSNLVRPGPMPDLGMKDISDEQQMILSNLVRPGPMPDLGIQDISDEQRAFLSNLVAPGPMVKHLSSAFEARVKASQRQQKNFRNKIALKPVRGSRRTLETSSSQASQRKQKNFGNKDALEAESLERTAMVTELENLGLDPAAALTAKREGLKPLDAAPMNRQYGKGEQYWTRASALNYSGNLAHLRQRKSELAAMVSRDASKDARILSSINDQKHRFMLDSRPPTPTLDLLTDYLQVKYQDVTLQRDASASLTSAMGQLQAEATLDLLTDYLQVKYQDVTLQSDASASLSSAMGQHQPVCPAHKSLSPQEIKAINVEADRLFDAISETTTSAQALASAAQSYIAVLRDSLAVARLKAAWASSLAADAVDVEQAAVLRDSLAAARLKAAWARSLAADASDAKQTVSEADREALLSSLTGKASPGRVLAQSVGGSAALEGGRKLWDSAAKSASYASWATQMQAFAKEDITRRRAEGEEIAGKMELIEWWTKPTTFEDAQGLWSSYQAASGIGPMLEDVLLADCSARASGSTGEKLFESEMKEMYLTYCAKHGSTSGTSPLGDNAPLAGMPPSWSEVQQNNASLDISNGSALGDTFRSASIHSLLHHHWNAVCQRFDLKLQAPTTAPTWDELWQLMKAAYKSSLTRETSTIDPASSHSTTNQAPAGNLVGGIRGQNKTTGDDVAGPPGASDSQESQQSSWASYLSGLSDSAPPVGGAQPPYPGARQCVRFRQAVVLDAASAFNDHPINRRVEMRVAVSELQREAGLSADAMKHILRVAGQKRHPKSTHRSMRNFTVRSSPLDGMPLVSPSESHGVTETQLARHLSGSLLQERLQGLGARQLSAALWSFAKYGGHATPHLEVMQGIAVEVRKKLPELRSQDLSNTLWALAVLKHLPDAGPMLPRDNIWALAKLGHKLPPRWVDEFLMVSEWMLPKYSAKMLSVVVWSAAMLEHQPASEWIRSFEEQVNLKFEDFRGQELACAAWALWKFGYESHDNKIFKLLQGQGKFLQADFDILCNPMLLNQVLKWNAHKGI